MEIPPDISTAVPSHRSLASVNPSFPLLATTCPRVGWLGITLPNAISSRYSDSRAQ